MGNCLFKKLRAKNELQRKCLPENPCFSELYPYQTEEMETKTYTPVEEFNFHEFFKEEQPATNGACFNGIFLPEEIVLNVLSLIPPTHLLNVTLVCKKWCNIIKSDTFWMSVYNKYHKKKAQKLPWYVFYSYFTTDNFKNLLRNGNGQEKLKYWELYENGGDGFEIEDPPTGADPLPLGVPEFYGHTSCFATSYDRCSKSQEIDLRSKRLLRYIIKRFSPNVYASEWVAGRFDCAYIYSLVLQGLIVEELFPNFLKYDEVFGDYKEFKVEQFQGKAWYKIEILIEPPSRYETINGKLIKCPDYYDIIKFRHLGMGLEFLKGHYGSKMAGGVLRFVFESIKPEDEH